MRNTWLAALLFCPALWSQPAADVEAVVSTEMGSFRFEFAPDKAPKHVEQFLELARQGYYHGSAFHRVVANGIIQGGDPLLKDPKTPRNLWGSGGLNLLPGEISDLKHERGVISMARGGDPDSAGSQFFICHGDAKFLDRQYTAFGELVSGEEVLEAIANVPTSGSERSTPVERVALESVTIVPAKD